MRRFISVHFLFALVIFQSYDASARIKIDGVHVFGESLRDTARQCSLTLEPSVAAVESTLRSNAIPLLSDSESWRTDFIQPNAYINFVPVSLSSSSCALSWRLNFYLLREIPIPGEKTLFSEVELCSESGVLSGPTVNLQSRVNEELRTATEVCISRIETLDE
jgi:hypothetical protein